MYPIVYDKGDINLENRLEILDKIWDFSITEEVNGLKELEFKISVKDDKFYCVNDEARIKFENNHFIIRQVTPERTNEGELVAHVKAFLNAIELREHMNEVLDIDTQDGQQALTQILDGNSFGWTVGTVDVPVKYRNLKRDWYNALENLFTAREIWGGYLVFDSINRVVHLKANVGVDNGFRIEYGKNLESIKKKIDYKEMYTVLYPFGDQDLSVFGYNGYTSFYIENYDWYINQGYTLEETRQKFKKVRYIKDTNYVEQKALWDDFTEKLAENSKPKITYEIKFIDRSKFEEFAHEGIPGIGDITRVIDPDIAVDTQRVVKIKRYPHEPWRTEFTLSNYKNNLVDILKRTVDSSKITQRRNDIWDKSVIDISDLQEYTQHQFSDIDYVLNEIASIDGTTVKVKGGALEAGSIMAWAIGAGQITGDHIAANTITGDNIAANTITGENIQAKSISADALYGGTIDSSIINVDTDVTIGNFLYLNQNIEGVDSGISFKDTFGNLGAEIVYNQNQYKGDYLFIQSDDELKILANNSLKLYSLQDIEILANETIDFYANYINFHNANITGLQVTADWSDLTSNPFASYEPSDFCQNMSGQNLRFQIVDYGTAIDFEVWNGSTFIGYVTLS